MRAWRVHRFGRPSDALELDEIPEPVPGPGEVLVRARASVLNYNEVDGCYGRYLTINPPLPYTLGMELTGVVEAAGQARSTGKADASSRPPRVRSERTPSWSRAQPT